MHNFKFLIVSLTALCLALRTAQARAEDQGRPSNAKQAYQADENIHGRVASFDGGYNLSVRDERGYLDSVRLHPGTIINPTGLTLAPGMVVSILGYNAGSYFAANQVDTPYDFYGAIPYYAGHPWDYYGPSISLGFFFGNPGWWHGRYFHGGYHYAGGARATKTCTLTTSIAVMPATFTGRDFVAPREHGGYYGHDGHDGHGR